MTVESATYISSLNASYPAAGDPFIEGDDHIRLLKSTIKATLPNVTGAVTATQGDLNVLAGAAAVVVLASTGIGYGTGSGGTVTQATSKSTAATLNKACGAVTMSGAALAANTVVAFTLTNSLVVATDVVQASIVNSSCTGSAYNLWVTASTGFMNVYLKNISTGSLSESVAFNFTIGKGSTS